jgi:hypothetical protein
MTAAMQRELDEVADPVRCGLQLRRLQAVPITSV